MCPKCRSQNVSPNFEMLGAGIAFDRFVCNNCGYEGRFFPELIKKNLKKRMRR